MNLVGMTLFSLSNFPSGTSYNLGLIKSLSSDLILENMINNASENDSGIQHNS